MINTQYTSTGSAFSRSYIRVQMYEFLSCLLYNSYLSACARRACDPDWACRCCGGWGRGGEGSIIVVQSIFFLVFRICSIKDRPGSCRSRSRADAATATEKLTFSWAGTKARANFRLYRALFVVEVAVVSCDAIGGGPYGRLGKTDDWRGAGWRKKFIFLAVFSLFPHLT
jgi:hypothetical protein